MSFPSSVRKSLILMILTVAPCGAQIIRGTVQNKTTGNPAPGDQVLLIHLIDSGFREEGRTVTSEDGTFTLQPPPSESPTAILIRVIHDGVGYDQPVQRDLVQNIPVYDSAHQVKDLTSYLSILQFQVRGHVLEVTELHAINNDSKPPMTQVGPSNFELFPPDGAQIRSATVAGPDNQPLKLSPTLIAGKGPHYQIDLPIKPGLTKYALSYDLPYSDRVVFRRRVQYLTKQFSILLPVSMRFRSIGRQRFHRAMDQQEAQFQALGPLKWQELLAFELSGTGDLPHYLRQIDPSAPPEPTLSKPALTAKSGMEGQSQPTIASGAASSQSKTKPAGRRAEPQAHVEILGGWVPLIVSMSLLGAVLLWIGLFRKSKSL